MYLSHALMVGGAEEMVLNLTRHLPDRFEPIVCCVHEAGPIGEEIRSGGDRVDVLHLVPGIRRPQDFVALRRYIRRVKPHIVHTFLMTGSLYGRLAAILERVPVVIGTEVNIYARKPWRHIVAERLLMAGTDRIIASAQMVREAYIAQVHADPAKVDVIYNAVDWDQLRRTHTRDGMRQSLGIPASAPVAGVIARLNEQKGHPVLFAALADDPRLADVHLVVVGGGAERERLERLARTRNIDARVHMVGPRRDLGDLLGAMDVFVLPSLWEGLPLSLVLAMGAGLAVVATSVGGVAEVVQDGSNGRLVPAGDSTALGNALAALFADVELRERLGRAAQATVRPRFGVGAYVDAVVRLYDRLLDRRAIGAVAAARV
jgi:glycosyltransferase involved in cell wall biosynthesis